MISNRWPNIIYNKNNVQYFKKYERVCMGNENMVKIKMLNEFEYSHYFVQVNL